MLRRGPLEHIREKIEKTPVEEVSFPHFIIEDILPETLHEAGQYFWPYTELPLC